MIIVDTSVWVEFFKGFQPYFPKLSKLLEEGRILAMECIFGELMQGAKNKHESKRTDMNIKKLEKATFAGGCFWCMQHPFDELSGVISTTVGYTGGQKEDPSYEEVCAGNTGHAEAIEILYDPSQILYSALLDVFWRNIDPTTLNKQFADVGSQYRTAIFYHNKEQKSTAEASREAMDKSGRYDKPIVTEVTPASIFYKAEEYHQKYYEKCHFRYKSYKFGSGREQYLKKKWETDSGH